MSNKWYTKEVESVTRECSGRLKGVGKHMTFKEKLELFKSRTVGFLVDSQEIADELVKVFEREGIRGEQNTAMLITDYAFGLYGNNCGATLLNGNLVFSDVTAYQDKSFEFLKLTPEEIG